MKRFYRRIRYTNIWQINDQCKWVKLPTEPVELPIKIGEDDTFLYYVEN